MKDWNYPETLVVLYVLLAFVLGSSWTSIVELAAPIFTVDNQIGEVND